LSFVQLRERFLRQVSDVVPDPIELFIFSASYRVGSQPLAEPMGIGGKGIAGMGSDKPLQRLRARSI
jgi:hypothetical protein